MSISDDGTVRASNPDSNDNFDIDGTDIDVSGFSADIFGTTITDLRVIHTYICIIQIRPNIINVG